MPYFSCKSCNTRNFTLSLTSLSSSFLSNRATAYRDIERLSEKGLSKRLLRLVNAEVGQQVSDSEYRVRRVFADIDHDLDAIAANDHAMQRQGNSHHWYFLMPP